jgi:hypothetical protein
MSRCPIPPNIWANQTEKGTRYNGTFERSYRDGEEWKSPQSFDRDDLLLLGLMTQWAFEWIVAQPGNGNRCDPSRGPAVGRAAGTSPQLRASSSQCRFGLRLKGG